MKRHLVLTALAAVAAVSASAEVEHVFCVVCGKEAYVDTYKAGWEYHQSSGGNGYVCPGEDCRKKAFQWSRDDAKRGWEIASAAQEKIKNRKELKKLVKGICVKHKYAMIALKGKPQEQIKVMRELVGFCAKNNCNAEDIWCIFAAYADLEAVKYFWPDPSDEKVYLVSKKQMELNHKKQKQADQRSSSNTMNALLGDKKAQAEMLGDALGGDGVKIAEKTKRRAFALGRSKKDNSIRFVDSRNFSVNVLAAALTNNRADVLTYLFKQTGGCDEHISTLIVMQWLENVGKARYGCVSLKKQLETAEKARKEADDKFDIAKIDKRIRSLKSRIGGMKIDIPSKEALATVLLCQGPIGAAEIYYKTGQWAAYGFSDDEESTFLQDALAVDAAATPQEKMAAFQKFSSRLNASPKVTKEDKAQMSAEIAASVHKVLDDVFAAAQGELGKWYQWRSELKKNWRAGVFDKWLPALVSGKTPGEWLWVPDRMCEAYPGKASEGEPFSWHMEPAVPSASHPGCLNCPTGKDKWEWIWVPGTPDLSRPGYFAAEKEGTFVWKAGIPDPDRIGMVTGAKEGEWVLAPGFQKQADGKVRWVAGLTDPARPGIVSTDKMFCWIPDGTHLWLNDGNREKDRRHIHSEHKYRLAEISVKRKSSHEYDAVRYESDYMSQNSRSDRDAQFYLSLKDYDEMFKELNADLAAVEEHKILNPTVEKMLEGNNRRRY